MSLPVGVRYRPGVATPGPRQPTERPPAGPSRPSSPHV